MSATRADIDAFHNFAVQQIAVAAASVELDELLLKWYDSQNQGEIDEIIRQGLHDSDAGLGVPAREATDEIRRKHGV